MPLGIGVTNRSLWVSRADVVHLAGGQAVLTVEPRREDRPDGQHVLLGAHPPAERQVFDNADTPAAQRRTRRVRRAGTGRASPVADRHLDRLSVDGPGDPQPRTVQRPGMTYRV